MRSFYHNFLKSLQNFLKAYTFFERKILKKTRQENGLKKQSPLLPFF